jgi:hypothetical protein
MLKIHMYMLTLHEIIGFYIDEFRLVFKRRRPPESSSHFLHTYSFLGRFSEINYYTLTFHKGRFLTFLVTCTLLDPEPAEAPKASTTVSSVFDKCAMFPGRFLLSIMVFANLNRA